MHGRSPRTGSYRINYNIAVYTGMYSTDRLVPGLLTPSDDLALLIEPSNLDLEATPIK